MRSVISSSLLAITLSACSAPLQESPVRSAPPQVKPNVEPEYVWGIDERSDTLAKQIFVQHIIYGVGLAIAACSQYLSEADAQFQRGELPDPIPAICADPAQLPDFVVQHIISALKEKGVPSEVILEIQKAVADILDNSAIVIIRPSP